MPNLTDKLVRDQRIKKEDIKKIEIFISEALKFNKHHNIFVRNSKEEIFEKDVFDCLPAINMIKDKQKVLDLGSGGGFPGILIGILKNHTKVFLLEKNQKKISFLNKIIFQLNLTNTETINTSLVEKNNLQNFDVITARAFSSINNVSTSVELCMLTQNGKFSRRIADKSPSTKLFLTFLTSNDRFLRDTLTVTAYARNVGLE